MSQPDVELGAVPDGAPDSGPTQDVIFLPQNEGRQWRVFLLFLLLGFAAYAPTLFNDFSYDDATYMERMGGDPPAPLGVIIDPERYGAVAASMSWRPLGTLVFMLVDVRLLMGSPILAHGFHLLLHVLNAFLLWQLIRYYAGDWDARDRTLALLAAAAFLLHPLTSETVYSEGFEFDILALLFILCGLHIASRQDIYTETEMARARPGSPLAFTAVSLLLALGAKELGVVLVLLAPVALLLVSGNRARALQMAATLMVVAVAYGLVWRLFQYENYTTRHLGGGGPLLGFANFLVASAEVYLPRLFWPWPLRIDHDFQEVTRLAHPRVMVALVSVGAAGLVAGLLAWRDKIARLGLLWFMAAFFPVAGLIPVPDPVAERFCYVPMAGGALILFAGLRWLITAGRVPLGVVAWVGGAALLAAATLVHRRGHDWRDDLTINVANWETFDPEVNDSARRKLAGLYLMRADAAARRGELDIAAEDRRRSRRMINLVLSHDPCDAEAMRLAVVVHLQDGDLAGAREQLAEALALHPSNANLLALARMLNVEQQPPP